jgi:uncharacterized membrane protein YcaP (DUF421 family)
MDAVLRGAAVYLTVFVLFRLSGKRTLAQITTFDFVLLLIISEATQQALLGQDFSLTMAFLVILTMITLDRASDYLGFRFPRFNRLLNDEAVVLVEHGAPHDARLRHLHLSLDDVMEAAREKQGVERVEQIKYAVLERNGSISVIPAS